MNYLSMVAGDLLGTVGTKIAKEFVEAISPNKGGNFMDLFQQKLDPKKLNLDDLNLSPDEQSKIMELRNMAMNEGIQKFKVEIHGTDYEIHTKDLSLTPIIA